MVNVSKGSKLMNRRDFITAGAAATGAAWFGCSGIPLTPRIGSVMTVRGAIRPDELGTTLTHEHALVDFTPFEELGPRRYDRVEVVETVLPHLRELRELGVQSLVDATPAYLGRDPHVLQALSMRSGLHIVTNTGYYGAREDQHVPDHAFQETAEEIAARWIGEWRGGIDGTDVRPGFMKIGVDPGELSETDAKIVAAAARTHLDSGLTIASHTGPAVPAFQQLDILGEHGVHPSGWIWVHAQGERDTDAHVEAARRGAWVEFDGVGPDTIDRHVELLRNMKAHGVLHRTLVSQDAGWYSVGEPSGGEFRSFGLLIRDFLPALRASGFSEEDVDRVLRLNPAEAFRIRVRELHA